MAGRGKPNSKPRHITVVARAIVGRAMVPSVSVLLQQGSTPVSAVAVGGVASVPTPTVGVGTWSLNGIPPTGEVLLGHDSFTDGTSPESSMLAAEAMTGVLGALCRIYAGTPQYTPSTGAQTAVGSSLLNNIAINHAKGRIPWYSFKMPRSSTGSAYTWAEVVAGDADAWVDDVAAKLNSVTTGPVWVAFHHEPDGEQTIADFRSLTRYLMPKITNPRVMKWVILAGWGATHSGSPTWEEGYPGDGYIDGMAFDPYNLHGSSLGSSWVEFGSSSPTYFPALQTWCATHPNGRAMDGGQIVWGVAETGWTDTAFDGYNSTDYTSPLGDSDLWYLRQCANLKTYGGIAMAYYTYTATNTWTWENNQAKATRVGEAETAHGSYYPFT